MICWDSTCFFWFMQCHVNAIIHPNYYGVKIGGKQICFNLNFFLNLWFSCVIRWLSWERNAFNWIKNNYYYKMGWLEMNKELSWNCRKFWNLYSVMYLQYSLRTYIQIDLKDHNIHNNSTFYIVCLLSKHWKCFRNTCWISGRKKVDSFNALKGERSMGQCYGN